jgi:hypothetical protein
MAAVRKKSARARAQDRARVAGGQDHEVGDESGKTGQPKAAVKQAAESSGNSRKKVGQKPGK